MNEDAITCVHSSGVYREGFCTVLGVIVPFSLAVSTCYGTALERVSQWYDSMYRNHEDIRSIHAGEVLQHDDT